MYQYHEFNPDVRLTAWVKNYWTASGFVSSEITPKVFPDGCTDIILIFNRITGTSYAGFYGIMTTFVEVDYPKATQMFGIRFKPAGISAFTRIPINEFTDRKVELALIDSLFDKSFYETIPEKKSMQEIIIHTDNYLINKLPLVHLPDKQIIRAVNMIHNAKGQLSLSGVASDVCLSQRHFERKFKSVIGISPKMFSKIFRFEHAAQHLQNAPHKDLLSIAVECGYYDHTHLIKDFKALTGEAPTNFRR
jgi:AraC-like DNA-binding protein